jgi:hypothetical protein
MTLLKMMSTSTHNKTHKTTKLQTIASEAPVIPNFTQPVVEWLEKNVRKPLEGTLFDTWIATPAKEYYITAKRRD